MFFFLHLFIPIYSCIFSVLSIFKCCLNFFTYPGLISDSGFVFLFRFLRGTPIWSQANSEMLSVVIFDNNLFNVSVFTLIFFSTWFMRDCNVVFFSVMIFFINSTFILSSCVNIRFVVLRCVVFRFSLFCVSIRLGRSLLLFLFRLQDLVHILPSLFVHIFSVGVSDLRCCLGRYLCTWN